jgi:O-antigen ligase
VRSATISAWTLAPAAVVLAAAAVGFACGFSPTGVQLGIVALAGLLAAAGMVKSPAWVLSAFWVGYCLHSTLFTKELAYDGLFYPLYLMMLLNAVLFLFTGRINPLRVDALSRFLLLLGAYVMLSLVSLSHGTPGGEWSFNTYQRAFIHVMALVATLQFWLDPNRRQFLSVLSVLSAVLCGWVIWRAQASDFAYRAHTGLNENYVAEIVAVGLLPAVARMMSGGRRKALAQMPDVLFLGAGVYSLLLLASRGVFLAFLASVTLAFLHRVRRASTALGVVALLAVIAVVLTQMPGADSLSRRFQNQDVGTFNDRTEIWSTVLSATAGGSFSQLVFGHGFDACVDLIRNHYAEYTSTHNTYVQVLYEFGAVGLIAFLSCHLYALFRLARRRDWGATAAGSMLFFFMACAISDTATDTFPYWLVLAYAAATACASAPPVTVPFKATFFPNAVQEAAS